MVDIVVSELADTEIDEARAAIGAVESTLLGVDGAGAIDEAGWRELDNRGLADARLWIATAGDVVGFALLRGAPDADLALAVVPDARGGGIGAALAQEAMGAGPERVLAWSHADHPAARRLGARLGFERVRELWVMERPATDLPGVPEREDVTIRAYRTGDPADERALLAINAAAFAHHPEQGAMDAGELAERMGSSWFDPAGLLLAEDASTGDVLGFHWTKSTVRDGRRVGEVYVVGIAPHAQGRGLGKLLTAAGLAHLAEKGADVIELYVEGDNHPARAVYEGLGFVVRAVHAQYARD